MSISKKENDLFERWKGKRNPFISDGVVNPEKFESKVVYILKEVNDKNNKEGDLRVYLRKGGRSQTWNNIALWTFGIINKEEGFNWTRLISKLKEKEFRKEMLQKICAFNIKKVPGTHTSKTNIINKFGEEDRGYLKDQFELYKDCNLFICCGNLVGSIVRKHVIKESFEKWDLTTRGIKYKEFEPQRFLISYSHPEARVDNSILYYGLIDGIKEIFGKDNNFLL